MTCTFFGHRNAPREVGNKVKEVLDTLIKNQCVSRFYVGDNGSFDYMVYRALSALKQEYPHICFAKVLAYLPTDKEEYSTTDYSNTVFPEGLENVPPRFAIDKRNRWMIEQADIVVVYVKYSTGGAAKFAELAKRRGKTVINLYQEPQA